MPELSRKETIQHRLASAQADAALRGGQKIDEDQRRILDEGASWERRMQRVFKGIITRGERRKSLARSAG